MTELLLHKGCYNTPIKPIRGKSRVVSKYMLYNGSNKIKQIVWKKAKGNKHTYRKLLLERELDNKIRQDIEKIRSLKLMLSKGLITQEEYDSKISTITP